VRTATLSAHEPLRAWRAQIQVDGVSIHIGYYKSPHIAARRYDRKAKLLFGNDCATNRDLGLLS